MTAYTLEELSDLTGVAVRTLTWQLSQGIFYASVHKPMRHGDRALLALEDVLEASAVSDLRRAGMSLQRVRRLLGQLRGQGASLAAYDVVAVVADRVIGYRRGTPVTELLTGQYLLLLPVRQWRERAEALRREATVC